MQKFAHKKMLEGPVRIESLHLKRASPVFTLFVGTLSGVSQWNNFTVLKVMHSSINFRLFCCIRQLILVLDYFTHVQSVVTLGPRSKLK